MNAECLNLSRQMTVVTPVPDRFDAYRCYAPYANLLHHEALTQRMPEQHVLDATTAIALVINRPPLMLNDTIAALRQHPGGQDLYVVVITPPDVEYTHQPGLDIDDYMMLREGAEVSSLIEATLDRYLRDAQLRNQFMDATKTALSAMDSASEYGSLVHFFELSEQCHQVESLAEAVYQFLTSKHLSVNFVIDTGQSLLHWPALGVSSSRRNMLERMAQSQKRMVCVDKLLGISATHFTLLVSNAPTDNAERYGQLKDSLAHFCAIVESRVKDIIIRERVAQQHNDIISVMELIRLSTRESKSHIKRIMGTLRAGRHHL